LRNLAGQEVEPLDHIDKVTGLLRAIKPAALKASNLIKEGA
jgi:hypothetical protein